mgnify:CR=1 FL=1
MRFWADLFDALAMARVGPREDFFFLAGAVGVEDREGNKSLDSPGAVAQASGDDDGDSPSRSAA